MTLWFSASAVAPVLGQLWHVGPGGQSWLTLSVQLGFVVGTLLSAVLNLADLIPVQRLFAVSAWLGAGANLAIVLLAHTYGAAVALRLLTGIFLAGVYPTGMKLATGWFGAERGLAIGSVVGALTLGSAAPHLFRDLVAANWRAVLALSSLLAVLGGAIVLARVGEGPLAAPAPRFQPAYVLRALAEPGVRLANFGYLGHMWELYAMWTWVPAFILASFTAAGVPRPDGPAALVAFAVVGIGALGSLFAGAVADRVGRTTTTIVAMATSGAASLGVGWFFGGPTLPLVAVLLIWGVAVVADSAQFSAAISELAEPAFTGTALTLQTSLGFLLTIISIRLLPLVAAAVSWRYAMAFLAIGPALGVAAMARLRALPAASGLAGGRG